MHRSDHHDRASTWKMLVVGFETLLYDAIAAVTRGPSHDEELPADPLAT